MLLEVGRSKVDEKYSDQARIENCKCQPGLCQKPRAVFLNTDGGFFTEEQFRPVANDQCQRRDNKRVVD